MTDQTEPAPMTEKEAHAMGKIAKWWRDVCAQKDMDPPIDDFRACLEASFAYMMDCRARGQMPPAPTRVN